MNFARSQIGILILIFFFINGFFTWFPNHQLLAAEGKFEKIHFSIRADNEPLKEVLKKISEASGYEIRFNAQVADERVSIQLDNVTLNEALARVLQAYNHLSLWNDANKVIKLVVFKKNSLPVTISGVNRIFDLATDTTAGP